MRERVVEKLGVPAVVALAALVVVVYCAWGASLIESQERSAAASSLAAEH